jgi:hypothetical protein
METWTTIKTFQGQRLSESQRESIARFECRPKKEIEMRIRLCERGERRRRVAAGHEPAYMRACVVNWSYIRSDKKIPRNDLDRSCDRLSNCVLAKQAVSLLGHLSGFSSSLICSSHGEFASVGPLITREVLFPR